MGLKPGQEKCINTLDRSLVVAAGAGSGKTFTLTKRIVHAIESGAVDGIERVCAITFTNKAAGELKSRIKAELRACGLPEQALRVDEAWVSTIHGMCARILRAHAVELDLDPAFGMIDPADARTLRDRAIEAVLVQAQVGDADFEGATGLSREALDALFAEYPARSYGPRGVSVESMVGKLMDVAGANAGGFEAMLLPKSSVNPAHLLDVVLEMYEALVEATAAQKPSETREAWMTTTQERISLIRDEVQHGHASDVLWALRALDRLPLPKRVGTADYKAQVSEAIEVFRICVMELRLAAAGAHLATIVKLAQAANARFAHMKRAEGVLDNNDLLVMASDAITARPEIARLYADKFQLVMVDEFQDTDQMQVDMIKKLAGPGACRLCTVGDAQQSIYRFRGADVSVYRRHLANVRAANPEDVILLPDNFRSHPDILSLVDRVFERAEMFGGEFMSLAPGRDEGHVKQPFPSDVPRIQVHLTSNSYRGASSASVREVAAARVADALADLHARGHSAGGMAILLGSMTYADVYASALRERGLACVISGGSVFARAAEVRVVLDLVHVIANPAQTESLHNVLTSPLFELDADDLLELATRGGSDGSYRRRSLDAGIAACSKVLREKGYSKSWSPQLALAVRVMAALFDDARRLGVSQLIMRAVRDSGWLSRLEQVGPEGLAVAANVYKAIRMVDDIESSCAAGPAHVARAFEAQLSESKEAPGALSATGGDFVRIMTVHASKGLEFPIVAVAEFKGDAGTSSKLLASEVEGTVYLSLDLGNTVAALEGSANLKSLPELYASMMEGRVDEDELAAAVQHADGALALRAALYERDRVGDAEEAKRLLYVALTRAKEALVVSLMGKRTKDNPDATPNSCLGALVPALVGVEGGFAEGVSRFEFGGSAAAFVEHVALEAQGEPERADAVWEGLPETGSCPSGEPGLPGVPDQGMDDAANVFLVPEPERCAPVAVVPYAPAHEGVFSYSSIADASHEGDVLDCLAQRFFVAADGALIEEDSTWAGQPDYLSEGHSDGLAFTWDFESFVGFGDEAGDDDTWAFAGLPSGDSDKATDLGTAFHRLAQYAVVTRREGVLVAPPASRIEVLARTCNLDDMQRLRLDKALSRWFSSDIAERMGAFEDLRAEVPFFAAVPADGLDSGDEASESDRPGKSEEAFLEGEIDLLGLSDDKRCAVVVDYKTGGTDRESPDELALKHVLQAACYAYAIMLQGVERVEAVFVRVERSRADDASQPQCVRYRFVAEDLPMLGRSIAQAYCQAHEADPI